MQVKHCIKKVGAVTGSAMMVGMTVGGAASLVDFPHPFVENDGTVNSQIVVGSSGKVADVVGAVNIASALGQSAVPTTDRTVTETSSDIDGKQYDVAIRSNSLTDEWIDKSSYSKLRRATVQDADGNDHRLLEKIGVDPDGAGQEIGNTVNGTETLATVDAGAVEYQVSYTPGFSVGDTVSVLGADYEVTAITQDSNGNAQLELGSKQAEKGFTLDDSYTHGPYTVTVVDKDEENQAIYLEVTKDGESLQSFGLQTGNTKMLDNGKLEITADEVFFGSRSDYIDVTSVYTDTTVVEGENAPFDTDYTVSNLAGNFSGNDPDTGTVAGMTLENNLFTTGQDPSTTDNENDISRLSAGESFSGPENYFNVVFQGLTDTEQEQISFGSDTQVSFTDPNFLNQSVAMQNLITGLQLTDGDSGTTGASDTDGNRFAVDVSSVSNGSTGSVTLEHRSWKETISYDGADFTDNTLTTAADKLGATPDVAASDLKISDVDQEQPSLYNPSDNSVANGTVGSMTLSGFSGVSGVNYSDVDVATQFDVSPGGDDTAVTLSVGASSTSQTVLAGSGSTTVSLSLTGQDVEANSVSIDVSDAGSGGDTVGPSTIDTDVQMNVSAVDTSAASGGTESLSFSTDGTQLSDYGTATSVSFDLTTDQRYARVYATGYGFDIGAEFVNSIDGTPQGIDHINLGAGTTEETVLYSGTTTFNWSTAARLTTGFGTELTFNGSYINSDGATVDAVALNETAGVDVNTAENVRVTYEDSSGDDYSVNTGEIGEVEFTSGLAGAPSDLTDDGDATITNLGSIVKRTDAAAASVLYPEEQRQAQYVLGAVGTAAQENLYEAVDTQALGQLPDMARLDGEVTESVKSNNHLILVGGPAVNSLVQTLSNNGKVDLSDVANQQSGAVLQVVSDAFTSGQHALVVAGYAADDTRNAARYLSNHPDHSQALSDAGDRLVLTEADYPSAQ